MKKLLKRRSEVEAREFDLSEAIADAMQILVPEAKTRNVALRATLIQRPLPVRADSIHLQQVILNTLQGTAWTRWRTSLQKLAG